MQETDCKKDKAIVQQILADDNCGIARHKVPTVSLRVGSMSISSMVNEIKDTLISELLDTVERVKNELRLRTDKKLEVTTKDANTLKDRLATLESGGITRKESMRSELAEQIRP